MESSIDGTYFFLFSWSSPVVAAAEGLWIVSNGGKDDNEEDAVRFWFLLGLLKGGCGCWDPPPPIEEPKDCEKNWEIDTEEFGVWVVAGVPGVGGHVKVDEFFMWMLPLILWLWLL